MNNVMNNILVRAKSNPVEFAREASIEDIINLITIANDAYYNESKSILTDQEYDTIKDEFEKREPNNPIFKTIGAPISTEDKVKLPYNMGSMNKYKDYKSINNWLQKYKGTYIITDKLDGNSGLLIYTPVPNSNNIEVKLYSRGNGEYGRDLSYVVDYINIPKLKNLKKELSVRGELIVSKKNFDKYKNTYANSRSMVNAILSKKETSKGFLRQIDFVAFELIDPPLIPSDQFKYLNTLGFKIPNITMETRPNLLKWDSLVDSTLYQLLQSHKSNALYDIDGLIITIDRINERNKEGNPKYSFAFKANDEGKITEILDITYNI